jgi:hypothetical protein
MTIDALLDLRDDVGEALRRKAQELQDRLSRLGGANVSEKRWLARGGRRSLKGRKRGRKRKG